MKNKNSILIFLIIISISLKINAQSNNFELEKQFKLSFNFISLEAAYELPISKKTTVEFGLGLGAGYYIKRTSFTNEEFGPSLSVDAFPPFRFKTKLKHIYNREKRAKMGKNNENNAGNYFALQALFSNSQSVNDIPNPPNDILLTELTWGLQRSLGGKWIFDINLGLGYANDFDSSLSKIYPAFGLGFSYVLN